MKTIFAVIMASKRDYAKLPFFSFLKDEALTPEQRLTFCPCMAHFIISFGDLNKYILRAEPARDDFYEDDHHWPWYIEDLRKLGFERLRTGTDWLEFLWSDETRINRLLSYRLVNLILNASSRQRLWIIEAIEETGNVLFAHTARLTRQVEERTGVELCYLGDFYLSLESGHAAASDHRRLTEIELDEEEREETSQMVEAVFRIFTAWTDELLRFAEADVYGTSSAPPTTRRSSRASMSWATAPAA